MKIIADAHIPYIHDYFSAYGELILIPGRQIAAAEVKEADILLVRSITPVNEKLLANSTVKFVGSITSGFDHVDTTYLHAAGIAWSAAQGFNAPPVADYVVSVIAAAMQENKLPLKCKLKAAVIGVGKVGSLVVERLAALNFEVITCDPLRAQTEDEFTSINLADISAVDLITLHVPLTCQGAYATKHFIDKHFLQRQKPGCVFINASRGAVINTEEFKQYGAHLITCLDVWEHEPKIDKKLLQQVFIGTPHIAGYSVQAKMRGTEMIYQRACESGIIKPQTISSLTIPQQKLLFSNAKQRWQDVVIATANLKLLTESLRARLATTRSSAVTFDEMRNQFNDHHEFAYTTVVDAQLANKDKTILETLGFKFNTNTILLG